MISSSWKPCDYHESHFTDEELESWRCEMSYPGTLTARKQQNQESRTPAETKIKEGKITVL